MKRIDVAINQLKDIFSKGSLCPEDYSWADVMGGDGVWSIALNYLSKKRVDLVDLEKIEKESKELLKQEGVDYIQADIIKVKLKSTAVLVRSSVNTGNLVELLKNNPQIEVLIHIPVWDHELTPKKMKTIGKDFKNSELINLAKKQYIYLSGPESATIRKIIEVGKNPDAQTNVLIFKNRIRNL